VNLQLELYKFQREFRKKFPSEKVAILQEATQNLARDFQNRRILRVEDKAPDFVLSNTRGQSICLSEQLNQGAVLLNFYFGHWCPYCNLELRAYQGLLVKIQALESSILGISPQTAEASQKTALKNTITFDLLSDRNCQIAHDYGLVFEVPDSLRSLYTELGHALPDYNGTDDWLLPIPATFIIDRRGHIALAYINVDYTQRYEPTDAIAILLSLFVAT
jgi:peroxiredoxin